MQLVRKELHVRKSSSRRTSLMHNIIIPFAWFYQMTDERAEASYLYVRANFIIRGSVLNFRDEDAIGLYRVPHHPSPAFYSFVACRTMAVGEYSWKFSAR